MTVSPLIEYFKYLQDLRSCITPAHRFSESNKTAKKAIRYFGLNLDFSNAKEVGNEIFVKSIYTLNTLIKAFSLKWLLRKGVTVGVLCNELIFMCWILENGNW